jgi:hypothetical protein
MRRFWINFTAVLLIATLVTGCAGQRETGKNKNKDKPQPADASGN